MEALVREGVNSFKFFMAYKVSGMPSVFNDGLSTST
jgi:hypothetical protein